VGRARVERHQLTVVRDQPLVAGHAVLRRRTRRIRCRLGRGSVSQRLAAGSPALAKVSLPERSSCAELTFLRAASTFRVGWAGVALGAACRSVRNVGVEEGTVRRWQHSG
jgi:hypothetical protein